MKNSFPLALALRLAGCVVLLLVGGCPLELMDQNAYQTGRVLGPGDVRVSAATLVYVPTHAAVDVGLGRGWEVGAGFGSMPVSWQWGGDVSVTRSLYSSRLFRSSVMLQAELAQGRGTLKPLSRLTAGAAVSIWPDERFGIYAPVRLSMVHTAPVTFPYRRRVFTDSGVVYVPGERVFRGLEDPVLTTGLGFAYESRRFYSRLAIIGPVFGPEIVEDSVTKGFFLIPYLGFQLGVRVF